MSAAGPQELETLRDWLRFAVTRFGEANLAFGHGTTNAYDEAAYLLLHALSLPLDRLEPFLDARLTSAEQADIAALLARRIDERIPAAYLTGEAWLGDFRFQFRGPLLNLGLESFVEVFQLISGFGQLVIFLHGRFISGK